MSVRSLFLFTLLPFAAASTAAAADYYVDAVNGNDANSGASPARAWRTTSHAMAVVPGGSGTIHIAPGLYDSALGESFPIWLRHGVALVGDQGSAATVFDGGGQTIFFHIDPPLGLDVRGLTLRNAAFGFWISVSVPSGTDLGLEDVVIEGSSQAGVYGEIYYTDPSAWGGGLAVTLAGVRIEGCGRGIELNDQGGQHDMLSLDARDCSFSGNHGTGVRLERGYHTEAHYLLERCEITDNTGDGVVVTDMGGPGTSATIASCLIADNGGDGVRGTAYSPAGAGGVSLYLSTIARNAVAGVRVTSAAGFGIGLHSCILYDNADDVADPFGHIQADYSDIGDGDFAGTSGNFSADPQFRAPLAGDYRLSWASPCVEAGDPALPAGTLDLQLARRPIDGDLDAVESLDLGAYEFTPLASGGAVHIGSNAAFEHWGPSGGRAILYVSRGLPMPRPLETPFGDFDLDPGAFRSLGTSRVQPGPPALRLLPIPNDPLYIGQVFSFQALSSSSVPSPTRAYTNPLTITILP